MFSYANLSLLGSILGWCGFALLYIQFILGDRFLIKAFTQDLIRINTWHQKLGKYGIVIILLHPIILLLVHGGSLLLSLSDDPFTKGVSYGKIALLLFMTVWLTSAILRAKILYRPWLYTHYISYPLLFFVFAHTQQTGTLANAIPALKYLLTTTFFLYLLIILHKLLRLIGLGSSRFRLMDKCQAGDSITIYHFKSLSTKHDIRPGQFMYLQTRPLGESHPFSCMEVEDLGETVKFGIKSVGKFTKNLANLNVGEMIRFDGPYGVFTKEGHNIKPKVFIAGGIGITPFVEVIKQFGNNNTYLFYSNRTLTEAVNRDQLKHILDDRYFDIITEENIQDSNIFNSRLTVENLNHILPSDFYKGANFFICGGKGFYTYYKNLLINAGVPASHMFYEKFGL